MDASILRRQIQSRMSERSLRLKSALIDSEEESHESTDLTNEPLDNDNDNDNEASNYEASNYDAGEDSSVEEPRTSKFEPWVLELPTESELMEENTVIAVNYATPTKAEQMISSARKSSRTDRNSHFIESLSVQPGATSKEDLESLGIVFLRLKLQLAHWLERFDVQVETEGGKVVNTDALYEALRHGDTLCSLANDMYFDECIKDIHIFNENDVMSALKERDNIGKFLKVCSDVFHIPREFQFEVDDLYCKYNMPRVILSLRAFARYAEKYTKPPEHLLWPDNDEEEVDYEEDDVLLSASEMSKLDVETVRQLYRAGQEVEHFQVQPMIETDTPETTSFPLRREIVGSNLKSSLIEAGLRKRRESLLAEDSESEESEQEEETDVHAWLSSIGLRNYADLFIQDGWDDLHTIAQMRYADLIELGIKKRGHVRKLQCAISRLGIKMLPLAEVDVESSDNPFKWRSEERLPVNAEEANSIWKLVRHLQGEIKNTDYSDRDSGRAMKILSAFVEGRVRELVPFQNPVVIDVGWSSIKYGLLHEDSPREMVSVVGRYKSKRPVFLCGKQLESQPLDELELRKPMHRGSHSITEPMVVHWDDIERLLAHVLKEELNLSVHKHPVLIIEPPQFMPTHRRYFVDIMARKIGAPAVYVCPSAPLVAYACAMESCIVLDIGESRSTASAVYQGQLVEHSTVHSPVGGQLLSEFFMRLLVKDGVEFKSIFQAQKTSGYLSSTTYLERRLASLLKERSCAVSQSSDKAAANSSEPTKQKFIQSDSIPPELHKAFLNLTKQGNAMTVGSSAYLVAEALFQPNLIRQEESYRGGGLAQIVEESIKACTEEVRSVVAQTVILTGGIANIPGLVKRLQVELKPLTYGPLNVVLPEDAEHVAWQGAAALAKEPSFQKKWVVKSDVKDQSWRQVMEPPLPLVVPEASLGSANKVIAAMHYLSGILKRERTRKNSASSRQNSRVADIKPIKTDKAGGASVQRVAAVKKRIDEIVSVLRKESVPSSLVLDVKLHLSRLSYEEVIASKLPLLLHRLPASTRTALEPYMEVLLAHFESSPQSSSSTQADNAFSI